MKFVEFFFDLKSISKEENEILIAQLFDLGFDSFEDANHYLKCYISEERVDSNLFQNIKNNLLIKNLNFEYKNLENKNWNCFWESNFKPIFFESGVIRKSYHKIKKNIKYDIIINPKMSFGTGHHETTRLMIKAMFLLGFKPNNVLDFGCGTAILSILSEKIWNSNVLALDNNEWALDNSIENISINNCKNIEVVSSDLKDIKFYKKFDLILANINTNVLLDYLKRMKDFSINEGYLILSGFYSLDLLKINKAAHLHGFKLINKIEDKDWQCITYQNIS
tara:strand:+ start:80 stop:916 length:837 start_codon:yes stop_codon:yes gene_type:complete